ncbi:heavy-metal-associated domain-containing protein [Phocea massiliensis]|uniref:Heavy-metal-associated domain-containing protein n=2 Tax=Merdimmobilis hominis TaxID=2897707 RepID=A0A938XB31_9FIRM|nr:heavy-metal-associated domain-containing protein [Merdimmobilis hominis]
MHCEKCSNRVTEAVNDIPGVAGVVDLKKGIVTVSYEQEVADEQIKDSRLFYSKWPTAR